MAKKQEETPIQEPDRLRALVAEKLLASGLLKTGPDQPGVSVEISADRIVTLLGVLNDQDQLAKTIQLVREIPGVKDVRQKINLIENWAPRSK